MSDLSTIHTAAAPAAIGPYSQAVQVNEWVFTSGQIPLDAEGNLVITGVREQTEQVFANLSAILHEAGSSLSQVVKATVFLANMDDFKVVNEVYAKAFGDHRPARSTVQVARLPRDASVEIEVIAIRK